MDYTYLLIFLGILFIPVIASCFINTNYKKYSKIKNKNSLTGYDVARQILNQNNLKDILIIETRGQLTDHYDSKRKVVKLSSDVYHNNSIASVAIAAHECGHAIQDKEKYIFMNIRSLIYPLVNFASNIAYIVLFIGFLTSISNLINVGILLISLTLIFQLVTLPVEINASARAKKEIKKLKLLTNEEYTGMNKILTSAALTYVAGLITSILEIIRLILISRDK